MGQILDRLQTFVNHKKLSIRQFEQSIGATNGVISKAFKNNTDISISWIEKIFEAYPNLNPVWLILGVGYIENWPSIKQEFEAERKEKDELEGTYVTAYSGEDKNIFKKYTKILEENNELNKENRQLRNQLESIRRTIAKNQADAYREGLRSAEKPKTTPYKPFTRLDLN